MEDGEPPTADRIKSEFQNEDENFIGELLDVMVYSDKKLTRKDEGDVVLYGIR
jgi:hypothetical protein